MVEYLYDRGWVRDNVGWFLAEENVRFNSVRAAFNYQHELEENCEGATD